ncbi:LRRN2 [Branchiostoma lanceolatum]|uniref:LRRN2 protein n=1 Tax=Branchiostoma lanceolatum TaxID=7740 RepID=A0A8K0A1V6_BRALA|nr:LRRN2 [Branchiostoma lanceolatum]
MLSTLLLFATIIAAHAQWEWAGWTPPCPTNCDCSQDSIVDCKERQLASIPAKIGEGVHRLNTDKILLQNNQITAVQRDTFNGILNLNELHLEHNFITTIEPGAFSGIINLGKLFLNDNRIGSLVPGTFSGVVNLNSLYLQQNELRGFSVDSLEGVVSLEELDLGSNQLSKVPSWDGRNPAESWLPWQSLRALHLDNNPLEAVSDHALGLSFGLEELYIQNMPRLRSVGLFAFRGLPALTVLHLHGNPYLSSLPEDLSLQLTELHQLSLRNNSLSALTPSVLSGLDTLSYLDVSLNPWQCDCGTVWLQTWSHPTATGHGGSLINSAETTCSAPSGANGQLLQAVNLAQFSQSGQCGPASAPPTLPPDYHTACTNNVCLNNGTCLINAKGPYCLCKENFFGEYCEKCNGTTTFNQGFTNIVGVQGTGLQFMMKPAEGFACLSQSFVNGNVQSFTLPADLQPVRVHGTEDPPVSGSLSVPGFWGGFQFVCMLVASVVILA